MPQRTVTSINKSKPQIRNWIYANRSLFRPGSVIPVETITNFFGITLNIDYMSATQAEIAKAIATYNLAIVKSYTKLNQVLALRGIAVSARDYYKEFAVRTRQSDRTTATIEGRLSGLTERSQAATIARNNLAMGYDRHQARLRTRITDTELGVR